MFEGEGNRPHGAAGIKGDLVLIVRRHPHSTLHRRGPKDLVYYISTAADECPNAADDQAGCHAGDAYWAGCVTTLKGERLLVRLPLWPGRAGVRSADFRMVLDGQQLHAEAYAYRAVSDEAGEGLLCCAVLAGHGMPDPAAPWHNAHGDLHVEVRVPIGAGAGAEIACTLRPGPVLVVGATDPADVIRAAPPLLQMLGSLCCDALPSQHTTEAVAADTPHGVCVACSPAPSAAAVALMLVISAVNPASPSGTKSQARQPPLAWHILCVTGDTLLDDELQVLESAALVMIDCPVAAARRAQWASQEACSTADSQGVTASRPGRLSIAPIDDFGPDAAQPSPSLQTAAPGSSLSGLPFPQRFAVVFARVAVRASASMAAGMVRLCKEGEVLVGTEHSGAWVRVQWTEGDELRDGWVLAESGGALGKLLKPLDVQVGPRGVSHTGGAAQCFEDDASSSSAPVDPALAIAWDRLCDTGL